MSNITKASLGVYLVHPLVIYYIYQKIVKGSLVGCNFFIIFHVLYFLTILFSFFIVMGMQKTVFSRII